MIVTRNCSTAVTEGQMVFSGIAEVVCCFSARVERSAFMIAKDLVRLAVLKSSGS